MIPLRDTVQSRHYPVVTVGLICVNAFVFILQMSQGPGFQEFVYTYGLVPARYTLEGAARDFTTGQQMFAFVSFMFLHGGFIHILGNMWILYIFGDNVEDFLGSFYFLLFYMAGGLFSGISHMMLHMESTTPVIGASGAVAAVMGAYFILYPNSRILTLIPILFIPFFIEIPAYIFLGIWFMIQVFNAAGTAGMDGPGIAWWAHIGGFVFGVAGIKLASRYYADPKDPGIKRWGGIERKKSQHFQVIHPSQEDSGADLKAVIRVTPYEAAAGTTKTVNIPAGAQKRMYRVKVPSGVQDGNLLRLRGLGRKGIRGEAGDLYLEIKIEQPR